VVTHTFVANLESFITLLM